MITHISEFFPHAQMFIAASLVAFFAVIVVNIVDCIDAMITSRAVGRQIESAKLRHAAWKLAKYISLMIVIFMLDILMAICWTTLPYLTVACAIVLSAIEVISMIEHARLRKDKIAKVPSQIKDLIEFFGDDEIKDLIKQLARKKLNID